jgi:hypothetical protein
VSNLNPLPESSTASNFSNSSKILEESSSDSLQEHLVCRGQTDFRNTQRLLKNQSSTEQKNPGAGQRQNMGPIQQMQLKLSVHDTSAKRRTVSINRYATDYEAVLELQDILHHSIPENDCDGSDISQQLARAQSKVLCDSKYVSDRHNGAACFLLRQQLHKSATKVQDALQPAATHLPNCDDISESIEYGNKWKDFCAGCCQKCKPGTNDDQTLSVENLQTAFTPPMEDDSNSEKSDFDFFGSAEKTCLIAQSEVLPNAKTTHQEQMQKQVMQSLGQEGQERGLESDIVPSMAKFILSEELNALFPTKEDNTSFQGIQ